MIRSTEVLCDALPCLFRLGDDLFERVKALFAAIVGCVIVVLTNDTAGVGEVRRGVKQNGARLFVVAACSTDFLCVGIDAERQTGVHDEPDVRPVDAETECVRRNDDRTLFREEIPVHTLFSALREHLNNGGSVRSYECEPEDMALIATSDLLSLKPIIYAANLDEDTFGGDYESNPYYQQVKELADKEGAQVMPVCARLEEELSQMEEDEKAMFMEELGIQESGLDRLIKASYTLLGLISFLTSGEDECRAWTITRGTKAPQAAGKIHSDFERGFIRAEVIAYDDMVACGSEKVAKEKGLMRSEGKDYVVQDGDIILFRFNV